MEKEVSQSVFAWSKSTIKTAMFEMCPRLPIKMAGQRQWRRSAVFVVNFEQISKIVLVFALLLWISKCRQGYLNYPIKKSAWCFWINAWYFFVNKKKLYISSENISIQSIFGLTLLTPMFYFYTPYKRQKTKGFLTFSGVIGIGHWRKKD